MDKQQFVQLLAAASSGDNTAAQQLQQVEETNLVQLYLFLCQLLSDATTTPTTRLQSIIVLSNTVRARSSHQQKLLNARWISQDPQMRAQIRQLLLTMLDSPVSAFRETTVQAIAAIAISEIPFDQWQELIPQLCSAASSTEVNTLIRISSISIIGECCAAVSHDCAPLGQHTDIILNSISSCVADPDLDLRKNGLKALNNTIKFCQRNFAKQNECTFLMKIMTDSATPKLLDEKNFEKQYQVQAHAWDCLSTVVIHYYGVLQPFIIDIFNCSITAIKQALVPIEDELLKEATQLASIQAIEFWHSLAVQEEEIENEIAMATEHDEQPDVVNLHYINHALEHIAPLLFQCLCLQGEDPEDESYNITLSALNALTLFAAQSDAKIFNLILPTVESSISSPDWRYRDAALTALGCLLSSPAISDEELQILPTLKQAFTVVITLFQDSNDFVATSSGWCIKQYCRYGPLLVFEVLDNLVQHAFLPALQNFTKRRGPTQNICQAIYELSQNISEMYQESIDLNEKPAPNQLQPYFQPLAQALLLVSDQATNSSLLVNAYEALVALLQCKAGTGNPNLPELLQILGTRLHQTTEIQSQQQSNLSYKVQTQGYICAALTHAIYSLPKDYINTQAANLLNVFTSVLNTDPTIASESMSGIEAIISVLREDFAPHVEGTYAQLLLLISRAPDVGSVVDRAFTVIGTCLAKSRCFNQKIGDDIIRTIFAVLSIDSADHAGQLAAINLFSDFIDLAGDSFVRYYSAVTTALFKASVLSLTAEHKYLDAELAGYCLDLQRSICRALDSFVVALGREKAPTESYNALSTNIPEYVTYAVKVLQDSEATDTTKSSALNLLADVFASLPDISPQLATQLRASQVPQVLNGIYKNSRGPIRKLAKEAIEQL